MNNYQFIFEVGPNTDLDDLKKELIDLEKKLLGNKDVKGISSTEQTRKIKNGQGDLISGVEIIIHIFKENADLLLTITNLIIQYPNLKKAFKNKSKKQ